MNFVLSGYFGFKNFGDEAILSVLVNKLKSKNAQITVISSNPKYTKGLYSDIESIYTFDMKSIIKQIVSSDVLVSGGGSLLQDVTSLKSLLYYLFIIFLGIIFNKKVVIFAQGIGPINNLFGKILTQVLLHKCYYISVRDDKSFELLKSWGLEAELVCDPIFDTEIRNFVKKDVVAIQLRDFKTLTQDFLDRLASEVSKHFADKEIEIYSFQDSIDLDICRDFENKLKFLNPDIQTVIYSNMTNEEIVEKLSQAKYLIAMRFHAIIIGLISKTKILSINYDTKVEKISREFRLPILDLKKSFSNQFSELKSQNVERDLNSKKFDWSGFDKIFA